MGVPLSFLLYNIDVLAIPIVLGAVAILHLDSAGLLSDRARRIIWYVGLFSLLMTVPLLFALSIGNSTLIKLLLPIVLIGGGIALFNELKMLRIETTPDKTKLLAELIGAFGILYGLGKIWFLEKVLTNMIYSTTLDIVKSSFCISTLTALSVMIYVEVNRARTAQRNVTLGKMRSQLYFPGENKKVHQQKVL